MTTTLPEPNRVNWNSFVDDTPADAPGDDCPDHGPYADDECPKCGPLATAQRLAQRLANVTHTPTYVVEEAGRYLVQDDQDLDCYHTDPAIVGTYQPAPSAFPICKACHTGEYPPSSTSAAFCVACANARRFGFNSRFAAAQHAATLQSQAIEQTMRQNRQCPNCQGAHYGWQCPEIARALFAPAPSASWKDIALGRELCRMRWRSFQAFVALLLSIPAEHLIIYAASYQAFIRDYSPDSTPTINDVLRSWGQMMGRGPAVRQQAA